MGHCIPTEQMTPGTQRCSKILISWMNRDKQILEILGEGKHKEVIDWLQWWRKRLRANLVCIMVERKWKNHWEGQPILGMDRLMNEWVNKWISICSWWQNKDWLNCGSAAVHSQNSLEFRQTQCSNFNWLAEQEQRREMRHVFCHFPTVFLFWACQGSPLEIIYGKSSVFSRRQGPSSLWILKYLT